MSVAYGMYNRGFNIVVVLLWLASMSWLVVAKVLPPLTTGEPPDYESLYAETRGSSEPVCWTMSWNGQPLGWAVNRALTTAGGLTELRSYLHFDTLPLDEMAPVWLRPAVRKQLGKVEQLEFDAKSSLRMDGEGRLSSFESNVMFGGVAESVTIRGQIEGLLLKIQVEAPTVDYSMQQYLPPEAIVGDELSPQARMPPLKLGQTWTVESYSPLRHPSSPMEVLEATVSDTDILIWDGRPTSVLLVVYRTESGLGFLSRKQARSRLWVREDGIVLRQELNLFGSRLTFDRLTAVEAQRLRERNNDPLLQTLLEVDK